MTTSDERQAIFVPMTAKLAFKSKAADLGKLLGRTVTQVELIEIVGKIPTRKLGEWVK